MRAPITAKGAVRLREELEHLKSVKRPAIIAAIAEAREHGDLGGDALQHCPDQLAASAGQRHPMPGGGRVRPPPRGCRTGQGGHGEHAAGLRRRHRVELLGVGKETEIHQPAHGRGGR